MLFSQWADLIMDVDDAAVTTNASNTTVTPSHRIPSEIIVKIIHGLLPAKIDSVHPIQERLNALLTATSICRYWRYAALDHATLWSVVPIDRKTLGVLFLQRSRDAPLLIAFEVNTRKCCPAHQAMVSLLPHMQRVKKFQVRAPIPVLNEVLSTLNRFGRGGQLEEMNVRVDECPSDVERKATVDLLLEHASTLKVLRLDVFKCRFPAHQLQQFPHLSHLELLSSHDIHDVSSLLTSFPTLTSIKVRVKAPLGRHESGRRHRDRIVPQPNLRHIHLQIECDPPNRVVDALKIQTGVHLECELVAPPFLRIDEPTRFLPLSSELFENTSNIEEMRISISSYSGSGPNGSFCINGVIIGRFQPPIEDFSHLRKLVVDGALEQRSLEDVVGSAPRLVSVVFINCVVIKTQGTDLDFSSKVQHSSVDAAGFVKVIGDARRVGADACNYGDIMVNGTLEGKLLEEFRSLSKTATK